MKLRHLLTGTILTVSLLAATAITALAAAPKGRFENSEQHHHQRLGLQQQYA